MKKLILVLQIIALFSQSVHADTTGATTVSAAQEVIPQMPKNYKLPDMQLLDSVAFYNKYKNQQGQRVDVQGVTGRFGATFGEEFKRRIYDIERTATENVEIILTLTSTMADAKILRDRMALSGRKMVIVEIPDHIQEHLIARAEAEAAGGIKELWHDTKDKLGKLINIRETLSNSKKIIANQFVTPSKNDIGLVWVSVASTAVTTALLLTVGNVDPALALSLGAMRAIIGGTTLTYHRTISNLFRSDFTNELNIISTPRRALSRLTVMGLGLGQFYYLLGTAIAGNNYKMTQAQIFTNTYTSGFVETLSSEERNNRLSARANHNMIIGHIIIGAAISSAAIVGFTGPLVYDNGIIQVSTLLVGTLALYTGFFFGYKYFSRHVEKVAQHDLSEIALGKWKRFVSIREARAKRIAEERLEVIERKESLNIQKERLKMQTAARTNNRHYMCAGLFQ